MGIESVSGGREARGVSKPPLGPHFTFAELDSSAVVESGRRVITDAGQDVVRSSLLPGGQEIGQRPAELPLGPGVSESGHAAKVVRSRRHEPRETVGFGGTPVLEFAGTVGETPRATPECREVIAEVRSSVSEIGSALKEAGVSNPEFRGETAKLRVLAAEMFSGGQLAAGCAWRRDDVTRGTRADEQVHAAAGPSFSESGLVITAQQLI